MADPTPAPGGIRQRSIPSFSHSRAACKGAAPPKAIIRLSDVLAVLDPHGRGRRGHVLVHHLADAEGGGFRRQSQPVAHLAGNRDPCLFHRQPDRPAREVLGVDLAQHGSASVIAGRWPPR